MKRLLPLAVVLLIIVAFLGTLGFLYQESQPEPEPRRTVTVERRDVVLKTVATGAIEPRVEVAVKPAVSGVVSALHVEPGQQVQVGDLIAELRIIPNSERLASAQSAIQLSRIRLADAERELEQAKRLQGQGAASRTELELAETTFELRQQELRAAQSELQIVKTGATSGSRERSTEVRAHVAGMVLTVPVEVGYSVIETNSFNEGTTIASVADMGDLVFEGTLDESEVGKVAEGMPLDITVGAFPDERFEGSLEYISPKGEELNGAVVFAIRAALTPRDDIFVRAGISANADIVLKRAQDVLAIDEAALIFEDDGLVQVELEDGSRKAVELGLSDGLRSEVSGLNEGQVAYVAD